MAQESAVPLTLEELQFLYDYICVLTVHGCSESARFLDKVERAIEDVKKDDPKTRALNRLAVIRETAV